VKFKGEVRRKVRQQLANYYNKLMEYKFYSEYIVQKARILRRKESLLKKSQNV